MIFQFFSFHSIFLYIPLSFFTFINLSFISSLSPSLIFHTVILLFSSVSPHLFLCQLIWKQQTRSLKIQGFHSLHRDWTPPRATHWLCDTNPVRPISWQTGSFVAPFKLNLHWCWKHWKGACVGSTTEHGTVTCVWTSLWCSRYLRHCAIFELRGQFGRISDKKRKQKEADRERQRVEKSKNGARLCVCATESERWLLCVNLVSAFHHLEASQCITHYLQTSLLNTDWTGREKGCSIPELSHETLLAETICLPMGYLGFSPWCPHFFFFPLSACFFSLTLIQLCSIFQPLFPAHFKLSYPRNSKDYTEKLK